MLISAYVCIGEGSHFLKSVGKDTGQSAANEDPESDETRGDGTRQALRALLAARGRKGCSLVPRANKRHGFHATFGPQLFGPAHEVIGCWRGKRIAQWVFIERRHWEGGSVRISYRCP
jgi:hypothetical protein